MTSDGCTNSNEPLMKIHFISLAQFINLRSSTSRALSLYEPLLEISREKKKDNLYYPLFLTAGAATVKIPVWAVVENASP